MERETKFSRPAKSPEELAKIADAPLKAALQVWHPDILNPEYIKDNLFVLTKDGILSDRQLTERQQEVQEQGLTYWPY